MIDDALTSRQLECYRAIESFWKEKNIPPTKQELATMMGVNPTVITSFITILQRKGYVYYEMGTMRCIRIIKPLNGVETAPDNS